jgi:hypothetical protein
MVRIFSEDYYSEQYYGIYAELKQGCGMLPENQQ